MPEHAMKYVRIITQLSDKKLNSLNASLISLNCSNYIVVESRFILSVVPNRVRGADKK